MSNAPIYFSDFFFLQKFLQDAPVPGTPAGRRGGERPRTQRPKDEIWSWPYHQIASTNQHPKRKWHITRRVGWREPRLMVQKECRTSFPQISTGAKNSASCTSLPPSRPSTAPPRTGPSRRNRTASGWSDHLLVFFLVFFVVFFWGGAGA